jgi:hypothetical protein
VLPVIAELPDHEIRHRYAALRIAGLNWRTKNCRMPKCRKLLEV